MGGWLGASVATFLIFGESGKFDETFFTKFSTHLFPFLPNFKKFGVVWVGGGGRDGEMGWGDGLGGNIRPALKRPLHTF